MALSDPTERVATLERENTALRTRVAELERKLARFDTGAAEAELGTGLVERESLLGEAERIAHLGSWVWDVPAGRVLWSDELYRILGYDPALGEASPEAFFARIHPEDRARVQETSARGIATGVSEQVDYRVVRPDGSVRYVTMNGALLFDEEGQLRRAVGTVLDVSELKRAALELRWNNELLATAQRAAKLAFIHFDVRTGESHASAEFYAMTGIDPSVPIHEGTFRPHVDPRDLPGFEERLVQVYSGRPSPPMEMRFHRPDHRVLTLYCSTFASHDADGVLVGIRIAFLDVSERAALEEELRQSRKMEAIGQLAGGIAHDFNNLLTVIQASAQLLERRQPSAELDDILVATARAAELVARLLAFGRRAVLQLELLDPVQLLDGALALLRRLLPENIVVRRRIEGEPWPISGDRVQLEQVVLNLALNARDAMPGGGELVISLRNLIDREQLELEVTDTGSGMDDATCEHAFEPFFTTKGVGEGTGLGLAMVFGTARQLGGTVEIQSQPGAGTSVRVRLPRASEPVPVARPAAARARPSPGPSRARILVVEDSEPLRRIMTAVLATAGHECLVFAEPAAALAAQHELGPIDLLVSDLVMPGMDGLQLAAELRTSRPGLPLLLITGYAPQHLDLSRDSRSELLMKPFSGDKLCERVALLLRGPLA